MPNFQRKRAQVLLICSLVSGLCWLPLRASQQAARARRGRRGLLAMCTPLWSVPAAQRAHFLSGSREASAWFQGHPKGFQVLLPGPPRSSPAPPGNAIPKTSHLAWSSEQFQNCPQQVGWGCIHCRLPEGEHSGCIGGTSSVADFALSVSLVPLAYADISDHLGSSSIICRSVWPQYHFQWLPRGDGSFIHSSSRAPWEQACSYDAASPHLQPVALEPQLPWHGALSFSL